VNATYTLLRESRLSADWSRRRSDVGGTAYASHTGGIDYSFWLPQRFRTQLSWRRNGAFQGGASSSYGISVDRSF
jgi:hypothetical protein